MTCTNANAGYSGALPNPTLPTLPYPALPNPTLPTLPYPALPYPPYPLCLTLPYPTHPKPTIPYPSPHLPYPYPTHLSVLVVWRVVFVWGLWALLLVR